MDRRKNVQSGRTPRESTTDACVVESAAERAGVHYERDPNQLVKVVHQVKPASLPLEGPTDFEAQDHAEGTAVTDVRVTPAAASVREAGPPED